MDVVNDIDMGVTAPMSTFSKMRVVLRKVVMAVFDNLRIVGRPDGEDGPYGDRGQR